VPERESPRENVAAPTSPVFFLFHGLAWGVAGEPETGTLARAAGLVQTDARPGSSPTRAASREPPGTMWRTRGRQRPTGRPPHSATTSSSRGVASMEVSSGTMSRYMAATVSFCGIPSTGGARRAHRSRALRTRPYFSSHSNFGC
jgi:hypothetical protein